MQRSGGMVCVGNENRLFNSYGVFDIGGILLLSMIHFIKLGIARNNANTISQPSKYSTTRNAHTHIHTHTYIYNYKWCKCRKCVMKVCNVM